MLLNKARNYNPTKPKKIEAKKETLITKLLNNRQEVIDAFKTGIFSYTDGFQIKEESEEESEEKSEQETEEQSEEESEEKKSEKIEYYFKKFIEYIENKSKDPDYALFKNYFNFVAPSALAKNLYETKNKNKNNELVESIKSRWNNLKNEIKKMSADEKEIEQPDKILKVVEEVLDFN